MIPPDLPVVDHAGLRTNQAGIISFVLLAFVFNSVWLVGLVGLVMLAGSAFGRPGFLPLYRLLRRLGWVEPDPIPDHPEPHRFAQLVGGVFLAGATCALLVGWTTLGWVFAWLVVALAALNLFAGFCVGCAAYYWLGRLGLRGFGQTPPAGTLPGRRPRANPGAHS
jgi:Domain of unknown function (DUF4395)